MGRIHGLLAAVLSLGLIGLQPVQGQKEEDARPAVQGPQAEVHLRDGSIVRMTLLQEDLEVQTKYGKLTIPAADIRKIDLGVHVPAEMAGRIDKLMKGLANAVYKERESAGKELVSVGHFALPALQRAAQSKDAEITTRAAAVLKQIRERVPADLLSLREEDVIQTVEFPVVGKITSATLKMQSPHFGAVALKLSDLRCLHMRGVGGARDITVNAQTRDGSADGWCDTGIACDPTQRLVITSQGQVDLWPQSPGQYVTGPKGYIVTGKGGQFMAGALIGKVGQNGKAFHVGEHHNGVANEKGNLFLFIVPSPWNSTSSGQYRVRVQVKNESLP